MDQLRDDLAKLLGLPPHNTPSNICYYDAYYALSLEKKCGASIDFLKKRAGISQ